MDFFLKYIQIEKSAPEVNENNIITAYEDALIHFGKENIGNLKKITVFKLKFWFDLSFHFKDLWLTYIEFKYGNTANQKQNVSDVYWRAKRELGNEQIDLFTHKLCLLKINLETVGQDIEMKYE